MEESCERQAVDIQSTSYNDSVWILMREGVYDWRVIFHNDWNKTERNNVEPIFFHLVKKCKIVFFLELVFHFQFHFIQVWVEDEALNRRKLQQAVVDSLDTRVRHYCFQWSSIVVSVRMDQKCFYHFLGIIHGYAFIFKTLVE